MKTAQELFDEAEELYEQMKHKEAAKLYEAALAIDRAFMDAYEGIISSYNLLEQYEKVIYWSDKSLEVSPTYQPGLAGKGNALRAMGKITEAIAYYDFAIKLHPDLGFLYDGKAGCLEDADRREEALECHIKNSELDPQNALPYANAAVCCQVMEKYDAAIEYINKALALDPHNPLYFIDRARVYELQGHKAEAIQDYKAAQAALNSGELDGKLDDKTKVEVRKWIKEGLGQRSSCCNLF